MGPGLSLLSNESFVADEKTGRNASLLEETLAKNYRNDSEMKEILVNLVEKFQEF